MCAACHDLHCPHLRTGQAVSHMPWHCCRKLNAVARMQSLAPVYYFFSNRITSNFIIEFVVTTVLIVVEFWYMKNVVGRRLCGMRWWQVPSSEGSGTTWRFEHRALNQVRSSARAEHQQLCQCRAGLQAHRVLARACHHSFAAT